MAPNIQKYYDLIHIRMSFLKAYDFDMQHPIYSGNSYVAYYSTNYFVRWSYGAPEYEISLVVGRRGIEDVPGGVSAPSIGELLGLKNFSDWSFPQKEKRDGCLNFDGCAESIEIYSSFLKQYAQVLFSEDSQAIYSKCQENSKKSAFKEERVYMKLKMNKAWEDKRSEEYIKIADKLGDDLTPLERKKYKYLKKIEPVNPTV